MEWEKAVVMRFGRFNRVAGPGIVFTWPIVEFYTVRIDQRVAATYFGAEETWPPGRPRSWRSRPSACRRCPPRPRPENWAPRGRDAARTSR